MVVGLVQAGETDWVLIPKSGCITRSGLMTGRCRKHLAVRHRNVGFGFWSVVTALATFALFGGQIMKTVSNERTSGNGAVTLWSHAQRLSRAVPECERWGYTRTHA